jgi:hypothetical protein
MPGIFTATSSRSASLSVLPERVYTLNTVGPGRNPPGTFSRRRGKLPAETYHAEVETTTFSPTGAVETDALDLLPELVERYAPKTVRTPRKTNPISPPNRGLD